MSRPRDWAEVTERAGTPWDKHTGPAKFECPGCGNMLQIFHNDPLWLEALQRAKSVSPKQAQEIMKRTGRCPICDRRLSEETEERENAAPERRVVRRRRPRPEPATGLILGLPTFAWILIGLGVGFLVLMGVVVVLVIVTSSPQDPPPNAAPNPQFAPRNVQIPPPNVQVVPPNVQVVPPNIQIVPPKMPPVRSPVPIAPPKMPRGR